MTANERFRDVIDYLIASKRVRNQQEFAEEIHLGKSTVSCIKTGKHKIQKYIFGEIEKAFPEISTDWLKTGEGEMLISIGAEKPLLYANMTLRQFYAGLAMKEILSGVNIDTNTTHTFIKMAAAASVFTADSLLTELKNQY